MQITKDWFKSSFSTLTNCVETQLYADGSVDVRNSNDPQGPVVRFTKAEWAAFVAGAENGEFTFA